MHTTHRRDIHHHGVTLCGIVAWHVARDFAVSECCLCEAVFAVLVSRDTEHWTPAQARAALLHAGWELTNV